MFGCGHDSEIAFLRNLVTDLQAQNKELSLQLAVIAEPAALSRINAAKRSESPAPAVDPFKPRPRAVVRNPRAFRDGARVDIPDAKVFLTPDPGLPAEA